MYWATFLKYAIALALLIIDWRCALVAAGMFVLFFLISACISVRDGTNLIRIYKEVKKRGSGALRTGVYQALISEIEKGIVATGGDLAKLNKMENEDLEWTSKTHMTHGHVWHANDNNSSQTNGGYSCFSQGNESDLMNDLSVKRHKEILESKDIRKYLELYEEAPTPVKISVVIWGLWVIIGLVLGFVFEESIQSNIGTAFVNALFIAAILRGSRWVRNFYAIGVLIFAILVGVNSIFPDSFIDDATSISIIINVSIAIVYVGPLFAKSAHSWFYGNRQDSMKNMWIIVLLVFVISILLLSIIVAFNDCESEDKSTGIQKTILKNVSCQTVGAQPKCNQQRHSVSLPDNSTNSRSAENMQQKAKRPQSSAPNSSQMSDKKHNAYIAEFEARQKASAPTGASSPTDDGFSFDELFGGRAPSATPAKPVSHTPVAPQARRMTIEERIATTRQAAEDGDLDAQTALGYFYSHGIGVVKDVREAVKWYRMAAEQGYVEAQTALGGCYVLGKGVEKDGVEALKWYRKAAGQGHADAQYYLGSFYALGAVVEQDLKEAAKWYRRAANQGHAEAAEALRAIDIQ